MTVTPLLSIRYLVLLAVWNRVHGKSNRDTHARRVVVIMLSLYSKPSILALLSIRLSIYNYRTLFTGQGELSGPPLGGNPLANVTQIIIIAAAEADKANATNKGLGKVGKYRADLLVPLFTQPQGVVLPLGHSSHGGSCAENIVTYGSDSPTVVKTFTGASVHTATQVYVYLVARYTYTCASFSAPI
jgi:hypothetical protein